MKFSHETGYSVEIGGADIYYETIGNEDAPPLLLLHGGVGSVKDFNSLVPTLAEKFHVIGIDSRGHGRSTLGSPALTYERLEQDAIEILRSLQIKETAVLGFSDGGIVGYRLMISGAVAVPKLITIGSPGELKNDRTIRNLYAKITGESWRTKFPESFELYQSLNPAPDFDRFIEQVVGMWLDSSSSGYPAEKIDNINGDVLIIRGDEDRLFSRQEAVDLANRIKQSALENIAFADHAAHNDRPDAVLSSIDRFMEIER